MKVFIDLSDERDDNEQEDDERPAKRPKLQQRKKRLNKLGLRRQRSTGFCHSGLETPPDSPLVSIIVIVVGF